MSVCMIPCSTLNISADHVVQLLELDTTIGPAFHADPYHIDVIRTQLTRGIGNAFPSLYDEIGDAFEELLPVYSNGKYLSLVYSRLKS